LGRQLSSSELRGLRNEDEERRGDIRIVICN
jgi:hypothetical protein